MNMVQTKVEQQGCYQLWSDCFGDSATYMDYYFTEKTKDNEIYQMEKDGEVISMLHLNPFSFLINGEPETLHYIVGVATKEEERGKGLMRQVLTNTLRMQQKRGELFTYLMPAAKEIYLPYDFRYMYTQNRVMGTLRLAGTCKRSAVRYEALSEEKKQEAVNYVNAKLEQHFDCAVVRDLAYYERLCKEMQAAGGHVVVMQEEDKLLGVCAFMLENGHMEVVETITAPKDTSLVVEQLKAFVKKEYLLEQVEAVWLETHFLEETVLLSQLEEGSKKEQPIIMARLLAVKEALERLTVKDSSSKLDITIKVEDLIIADNNQTFRVTSEGENLVISQAEDHIPVITVSISELTEWYFGVREIPQLEGLKTLTRPYINDIV